MKYPEAPAGYAERYEFLRGLKPYELLQELLATILGDGGQIAAEKGPAKAVLLAEYKWHTRHDATAQDQVADR